MAKLWLSLFTCVSLAFLLAESAPTHQDVLTFFKTAPAVSQGSPSAGMAGTPSSFTCETCKAFFSLVRGLFDKGYMYDDIAKLSVDICDLFKIEDHTVCHGIIWLFKDEVLTVFDKVGLSSDEACNIVIGESCGKGYDPWDQQWNVTIPGNKPPVTPIVPKPGSPVNGILHLTDIHYDPLYRPGLTHDCGEPLCCRIPNKPGNATTAAGYWGDYKCDVPYHTLVNLMQNIQTQSSQFDWVYWTGDLPAHNVWNNSRDSLLDILANVTDLMTTYFGSKTVFPSFGNHEGIPVNSFPPPFITGDKSVGWLYNSSAEHWAVWLDKFPEWDTINATIRKGGYYVVKVRQGLKVISMQTNYCNKQNYWLLINSTDPADQLQWLIQQLLQAERDGDKVHIIGHIAPGLSYCNPVWSNNYYKIVNRFESTIVGQFFGHTHHDSVEIFFDLDNVTRATNVIYIGQSVTTYQYLNLGYRFFIVDGNHNETTSCVIDHVNYYMDLNKTSEHQPPKWEFEYTAKTAYDMPDLQPQSWGDLAVRFQKNHTLFLEYFHHDTKMYSANSGQVCDAACECEVLCEMMSAGRRDPGPQQDPCKNLKPVIGNTTSSCDKIDYTEYHRSRIHC